MYKNNFINSAKANEPRNNKYNKEETIDPESKKIIYNIKYYDETKNVDVNLFSKQAEEIVNKLAENKDNKNVKNSITQLRRFYNDIQIVKNKIDNSKDPEEEFRKELPYIKMIAAKANYAYKRENITSFLNEFIKHNVLDLVNSYQDLTIFCTFFESIIAYATGRLKK
jgi:CRISPR type III-A-associated protein Csm2